MQIKLALMKVFVLKLFLFIVFQADAQNPFFKQFSVSRENAGINLNQVIKDKNGFLWIASSEGLYKYNGVDYTLYQLPAGNKSNELMSVYEDADGIIWAGYKNGYIASLKNDSLKLLDMEEGFPRKTITSISSDSKGTLIFTTAGEGVYFYKNNRLYNLNTDDGLNDNYCYASLESAEGNIWIGTDQGIAICDYEKKNKIIKTIKSNDGLPDEIVKVLKKGGDNTIWIGLQEKGICVYTRTGKIETPNAFKDWNKGSVNDMLVLKSQLWVATSDSGLLYFNGMTQKYPQAFQAYENVRFGKVNSITNDAQNNLWMACDAGLIRSHGMWLTFLNNLNGEQLKYIHAVFVNKQGDVFFTPDHGLMRLSGPNDQNIRKYEISPADIVCFYESDDGFLWIGTLGNGLYRFNQETGKLQRINLPEENLSVLSIAGLNNELWLGTFGGVVKITQGSKCNREENYVISPLYDQRELGNYYIYRVFVDSKKRIWFGSDQNGITCYSNGQFSKPYPNLFEKKTVYTIAEDKNGALWFSVADEGVVIVSASGEKKLGLDEGLRELSITSICPLNNDRVALIHKRGIDIVNTQTGQIDYLGTENNLGNINPDLNASARAGNGKIWLGTERGLVVFDPSLYAVPAPPEVRIGNILLYNNANLKTTKKTFKYDENSLAFEYNGIWFTDPSRLNYQYKLEGLNTYWIDTKDKRIVFPNLAPGKYEFKVRTSLQRNFSSSSQASFSFYISPPFWQQNWFRALLMIGILSAVYFFVKNRDERMRRLEALKKEKIEFEFETLKSQVNPHFLFNSFNTLINVIEEDKDKAVAYVEKLSDFFKIIVKYKDKQVITLEEELKIAENYFQLQRQRFGNAFMMDQAIDQQLLQTWVPPLVLQILLENVIKHNAVSSETPLQVSIYCENMRLNIKNNINAKRSMEPSTGTGLQNIINRYKIISNQEVNIIKTESSFIVSLPLIKTPVS